MAYTKLVSIDLMVGNWATKNINFWSNFDKDDKIVCGLEQIIQLGAVIVNTLIWTVGEPIQQFTSEAPFTKMG